MHKVIRTACALAMIGISPAFAAEYINNYGPEAQVVGQGRVQVLVWNVYDAKLYAPGGVYTDSKPFALVIEYRQELKGRQIADHAVSEMRRLGYKDEVKIAIWHDRMIRIFPDVVSGSVVTGIYTPDGPTTFYENNKHVGRIDDPAFGKEFFRIWLDARTSTPDLRQGLLNLNNSREMYKNEIPENSGNFGGGHAS